MVTHTSTNEVILQLQLNTDKSLPSEDSQSSVFSTHGEAHEPELSGAYSEGPPKAQNLDSGRLDYGASWRCREHTRPPWEDHHEPDPFSLLELVADFLAIC